MNNITIVQKKLWCVLQTPQEEQTTMPKQMKSWPGKGFLLIKLYTEMEEVELL